MTNGANEEYVNSSDEGLIRQKRPGTTVLSDKQRLNMPGRKKQSIPEEFNLFLERHSDKPQPLSLINMFTVYLW